MKKKDAPNLIAFEHVLVFLFTTNITVNHARAIRPAPDVHVLELQIAHVPGYIKVPGPG